MNKKESLSIQNKLLNKCNLTESEIKQLEIYFPSLFEYEVEVEYPYNFFLDIINNTLPKHDKIKLIQDKLLAFLIKEEKQLTIYDKGRLWHIKGYLAWRYSDSIVKASHYINKSIYLLSKKKTTENMAYLARLHDTLGQFLVRNGQVKDAIKEYQKASEYRKFTNDLEGYAITLGNIGRLYFESGNFIKARENLFEDLTIVLSQENTNEIVIAQLKANLALAEIELENYSDAKKLLEQSLEINQKLNNNIGICFSFLGLAYLYCKLNDFDKSWSSLEKVKCAQDSSQIPVHLLSEIQSEYFRIRAEVYLMQEKFEEAILDFNEALDVTNTISNYSPIRKSRLLYRLAKATAGVKEYSKAAEYMRNSLRYADLSEDFQLQDTIEKELKQNVNQDSWLLHAAGRFLGHQQVDFLIHESGNQEFESNLKDVVILFSDIRDFTTISEKLKPGLLISFLNEYMSMMTRCIEHFDGYIDKYIGDAIMSIFSLPQNQPSGRNNDAERATWAALYMMEELKRFNRIKANGIPALSSGIGIHSGNVVAGLIGSPQKRSYSAIGDTVNTASRIEGMTKLLGAEILVSGEVLEKYDNPEQFLLGNWGKYQVKGRSKYIQAYELMGINDNSEESQNLKKEIEILDEAQRFMEKGEFQKARDNFSLLENESVSQERKTGYSFLKTKALVLSTHKRDPDWGGVITLESK